LYKLNPNARRVRPVKLTKNEGIYSEPAWSYNSNRIVALHGSSRSFNDAYGPYAFGASENLIWVSADGGNNNFILKSDGRDNPHFVKTNDRIYLNRGSGVLESIRWDGTDEQQHVKI